DMVQFKSQRDFVRKVLAEETDLRTSGAHYVPKEQESPLSLEYRKQLNSEGIASEIASAGYDWMPGTELIRKSSRGDNDNDQRSQARTAHDRDRDVAGHYTQEGSE